MQGSTTQQQMLGFSSHHMPDIQHQQLRRMSSENQNLPHSVNQQSQYNQNHGGVQMQVGNNVPNSSNISSRPMHMQRQASNHSMAMDNIASQRHRLMPQSQDMQLQMGMEAQHITMPKNMTLPSNGVRDIKQQQQQPQKQQQQYQHMQQLMFQQQQHQQKNYRGQHDDMQNSGGNPKPSRSPTQHQPQQQSFNVKQVPQRPSSTISHRPVHSNLSQTPNQQQIDTINTPGDDPLEAFDDNLLDFFEKV